MKRERIIKIIGSFLGEAVVVALTSIVFKLAWNYSIISMFNLHSISWSQSFVVIVMLTMIFRTVTFINKG